ncbi:hypothetical protein QL285_064138 [Trifolium repens]|nr:hypothetical protein QL285_064138 [Trifolium repens]
MKQNRFIGHMAGQCHGTKRKESPVNANSRLLRPGDLAKATKKLAEANKKRLKKLGLSPTVQPTSSAVQETRPVVLAPPAVKETQPVAQPVPTVVQSTPQAVQQTQSVVQPTPSTVQTTPQAVQETIPVVQHSQVTAPTVAQATTPPSLEEENHLHDVDGKRMALRDKFRNVYQCWKKVPQDEWFKTFSDYVSWEPRHGNKIRSNFNYLCPRRLTDMLTKIRNKGEKPSWVGEDAYKGLLAYWKSDKFKKLSSQNKTNRGSIKGGCLHTTGRKAHHDLALDMGKIIGRPIYPDELFLATHKKKSGDWVDTRSKKTYDDYQKDLTNLIQTNEHSLGDTQEMGGQEVDGETRLSLWVDVAGGISRGQCYGTGVMSVNIRPGVRHLTQESHPPENEVIEMLRREAAAARAEAAAANERADEANQRADVADQRTKKLENNMADFAQRMAALENQSAGGSCSTTRPRPIPQHPHYDDDLDEQSEDDIT